MPIRKDGQLIEILHLTNGRRYHNHSNSKFVPEYFEVNHFEAKYFEPEIKEEDSFSTWNNNRWLRAIYLCLLSFFGEGTYFE